MSRAYIVTRNGGTVTKAPINDNKIPIYPNKTAMEADASNIPDGSIVFTKSDHDDVIDQMKEYIRNQNVLSAVELVGTLSVTPIDINYDGFITIFGSGGDNWSKWKLVHADNSESIYGVYSSYNTAYEVHCTKGDKIVSVQGNTMTAYARYYKLRDYSDRT